MSHCLAHGPSVTKVDFARNLADDRDLHYAGMVVVAATVAEDTGSYSLVHVLRTLGCQSLVCGFNPGTKSDGSLTPDPLSRDDYPVVKESLRSQCRLAVAFADAGIAPPFLVGPLHTWHMQKRTWTQDLTDGFNRWMDVLDDLARIYDLQMVLEILNPIEDGTKDPLNRVVKVARERDRFWLHYDLGHWHSRRRGPNQFAKVLDLVRFFEWTNVKRRPLSEDTSLDVAGYLEFVDLLHEDCVLAIEPFDQSVCTAFKLPKSVADPQKSGSETLTLDAQWLKQNNLMPS